MARNVLKHNFHEFIFYLGQVYIIWIQHKNTNFLKPDSADFKTFFHLIEGVINTSWELGQILQKRLKISKNGFLLTSLGFFKSLKNCRKDISMQKSFVPIILLHVKLCTSTRYNYVFILKIRLNQKMVRCFNIQYTDPEKSNQIVITARKKKSRRYGRTQAGKAGSHQDGLQGGFVLFR